MRVRCGPHFDLRCGAAATVDDAICTTVVVALGRERSQGNRDLCVAIFQPWFDIHIDRFDVETDLEYRRTSRKRFAGSLDYARRTLASSEDGKLAR
jgi:hypothetical protein